MSRYNYIPICVIVVIISYICSTVNALVGNICTSETLNQIKNINTTGVTIKVNEKEWTPESKISVEIDIGKENSIRNLVIWAETVDGEQPGTHVGYWSPISGHEYVEGCNGPANSTITNQLDLNLAQIKYEWNTPSETDATSPQPSTPQPGSTQPSTPQPSVTQPSSTQPSSSDGILPTTTLNSHSTPSPTCKPKKSKHHKHHKHHEHHKEHHKDRVNYPDFSDIATKVISGELAKRDQTFVGSIVFKGVLQLMNHPDEELYSFTSDVIAKSTTSLTSDSQSSEQDASVLKVSAIDEKVPKDPPPFSAAHSKFILKSHTLIGILTLIIGFFTNY